MQTRLQQILRLFRKGIGIWEKRPDFSDFVWLARFRTLFLYSLAKICLLIAAGELGTRVGLLLPSLTRHATLLFIGEIGFGIIGCTLLLTLGLGLANKFRLPRIIGILILMITDICLLFAVFYASMFNNKLPLLIVLAMVASTTPLFVERISRYAKRAMFRTLELASMRQEYDMSLLQHAHELALAIEQERLSLKQELHDGLLQELSALLLQVSLIMKQNTTGGRLQLNEEEALKLKAALERAVMEARKTIRDLQTSSSLLERQRR
jgi:signal transduction histidine kinase